MPKCSYCGMETMLHVNGVPVCVSCDDSNAMAAAAIGSKDAGKQPQPPVQTGIRPFNPAVEKDR